MQVKCIKRGDNSWITPGKIYEATEDKNFPELWCVLSNDDGGNCTYLKSLFEVVSAPVDSKIDVEALAKAIDGMTSVCAKGKEEIKAVLTAGFKVEFAKPKPEVKPAAGQIWKREGGWTVLLVYLVGGKLTPIVFERGNFASISNLSIDNLGNWQDYEYVGTLNPATGKVEP